MTIKKYANTGISFLIMATAAICSGYHFRWPTNAPALTSFSADLTQGGDHTVIVDLGEQSLPKLLLQPGRLRVSGQLNATGDLANSQTNLLVTIASSSEKVSVRPGARNVAATDHGYSYEVSLNSNPNPKPNPKQGRRGQEQEQLQRQEAKPNPKPKPGRGREQEPGTVPLSFELSIPYLDTIKHDIGSVFVKYIDKEQGSLQGQITFLIRNSRIGAKQ